MSEKITIRKGNIDLQFEKKIITFCITNTQFLKETASYLKVDSFQLKHLQRIFRWVESYFNKYDIAPNKAISDIFLVEKKNLPDDEAEIISDLLSSLSLKYVNEEEDTKENVGYYADKCREYVRKRNISTKINEINGLLSLDRIDDAEAEMLDFKKLSVETTNWTNPLSESNVDKVFESKDSDFLFKLNGDLGEVLGNFNRGCLYCFAAPLKIGKSWAIAECRNMALLKGLKVAEFNIEMTERQINERFYKRITGATSTGGKTYYPVMDCKFSQDGSCKKPERTGKVALYAHEDYIPLFEDADPNYKTCNVCKGTKSFLGVPWYENIVRKELTISDTKKTVNGFKSMWGDNYRLRVYPRFSATVSTMMHDLNFLEETEGFVPDVITVDYAGLVQSEGRHKEERHRISEVFKMLGRLGAEKKAGIITAAQINREGMKKRKSQVGDIAEDFSIGANVDGLYLLSQSDAEKERKICRVSVGAMRDGEFNPEKEVIILSDLAAGQWVLDSFSPHIIRER